MKRIMIAHLKEQLDQEVTVCGWVHTLRNQGRIRFMIVRDITGFVQVVVLKSRLKQSKFCPLPRLNYRFRSWKKAAMKRNCRCVWIGAGSICANPKEP